MNAKNLTLRRTFHVTGKRTFGKLFVEGMQAAIAVTMEPEYDPARAKVTKSDTAIAAGRYRYTIQVSPKHGLSLRYHDVPGRYDVLMHAGNTDVNTEGCTLPGTRIASANVGGVDEPVAVENSRLAMASILWSVAGPYSDPSEVVGRRGWIEIVDDFGV